MQFLSPTEITLFFEGGLQSGGKFLITEKLSDIRDFVLSEMGLPNRAFQKAFKLYYFKGGFIETNIDENNLAETLEEAGRFFFVNYK